MGININPKNGEISKNISFLSKNLISKKKLTFGDFDIKKEILWGIFELGYKYPSPIQEESIPKILIGRDIIARSKNGTGKTASYLIPVIQKTNIDLLKIQSLIIVPTRELALQVSQVTKSLSKYIRNIKITVTTGGTGLKEDIIRMYQSIHILIGTPGRILDILMNTISKSLDCKMLVLDEADKLLSNEFFKVVEEITKVFLHKNRQTILFSATFPLIIKDLKYNFMREPFEINLMKELNILTISQYYAFVSETNKVQCINSLLKLFRINQCILFCNSVSRVELLAKKILNLGYSCFFIHARMSQDDRNKVFNDFRLGKYRNLVSSDLFTRGIDVPAINLIINFDFPKSAETYLHRVGRSGRFGKFGVAMNLITNEDKLNLLRIENELGLEIKPIPNLNEIRVEILKN
jgi:ATP-dependent RNA helicase DDX6/DHH1